MARIIQVFILILIQYIFLTFLVEAREPSSSTPSDNDIQAGMKLLEKPDTNKISEALSIFEKALSVDPNQEEANMGIVYARLIEFIASQEKDPKRLQDGLKHAEVVLKHNKKNEDAYYKKSQILFFMGKPEEGLQNLKDGLKQLPKSETLHKAMLTYLANMAMMYEETGDNVKARLAWMKLRSETKDPEQKKMATEHIEMLSTTGEGGYGARGF
jgi:tetratricopeptide (TPR) repeat protein